MSADEASSGIGDGGWWRPPAGRESHYFADPLPGRLSRCGLMVWYTDMFWAPLPGPVGILLDAASTTRCEGCARSEDEGALA
jgi:hypothetical protein